MTPGTTLKNFLSFQLSEWECIFEIMIPQTYIPPIGGFVTSCYFIYRMDSHVQRGNQK